MGRRVRGRSPVWPSSSKILLRNSSSAERSGGDVEGGEQPSRERLVARHRDALEQARIVRVCSTGHEVEKVGPGDRQGDVGNGTGDHDAALLVIDAAVQHERGLYVLVRTSNPGAGTLQDICDASQTKIYQHVARLVERLAESTRGAEPYGCVGGVVGATYPAELVELRQAMPHTPLLIPGYGSQGAKAADVAAGFGLDGVGAVVNSSRAVIFAHEKKEYAAKFPAERWEEAVRAATHDMIRELAPYCQPRPSPA